MQDEDEDEDNETKLNNNWIEEFELSDKDYAQYYTENINEIKLQCIYVNKNNDIVQIKEKRIHLCTENCMSREELVGIIKRNVVHNNIRYILLSLLKYNIDIEPQNIKQLYLKPPNKNPFLTQIKNIDAITYNKTIPLFQKLNELLLLFYEKSDSNNNKDPQTKKIYINHKHLKRTQKHRIKTN